MCVWYASVYLDLLYTRTRLLTLRYEEGEERERTGMGQVCLPALESHLVTASGVIMCVEQASNFHSSI